MRTIRTLLSGGELFGVGARQASYTHLDGYEIDPKIAAVARLNGFNVHVADIRQVDYESLAPADHLHASPVCTRASTANIGAKESAADLAIADAICRAIAAHKGRTVSIENVWAYREFESFKKICAALTAAGFVYDFRHLNSADYGVPQTRKRLILRAVRGCDRVPGLRPTHGKRGGILLERWNGWYAAIEDLIPTLSDTQPAPWQLARMPKALRESMLVAQGAYGDRLVTADPQSPAFTITANSNQQQLRAFLVSDQNAGQEWGKGYRGDDEPAPIVGAGSSSPRASLMSHNQQEWGDGVVYDGEPCFSVTTQSHGRARAYIVGGGNTQLTQVESHARAECEPMFTISAGDGAKKSAAAWLVGGQYMEPAGTPDRRVQAIEGDLPVWTITNGAAKDTRAYTGGRWVRMDIRALGRFQTVPDDYIGLTPQVNGNGVPCLLARRIMESLRGCYQ